MKDSIKRFLGRAAAVVSALSFAIGIGIPVDGSMKVFPLLKSQAHVLILVVVLFSPISCIPIAVTVTPSAKRAEGAIGGGDQLSDCEDPPFESVPTITLTGKRVVLANAFAFFVY